jgi:hypothetical protein
MRAPQDEVSSLMVRSAAMPLVLLRTSLMVRRAATPLVSNHESSDAS